MSAPEVSGNLAECQATFAAESKPKGLFRAFAVAPPTFRRHFANTTLKNHILNSDNIQLRAQKITELATVLGGFTDVYVGIFDNKGNYSERTITAEQGYLYARFAVGLQAYSERLSLYDNNPPEDLSNSGMLPAAEGLCKIAFANVWSVADPSLVDAPKLRLHDPQVEAYLMAASQGDFPPIGL